MNKYELALVVSAKLDSEAIAATVQKAKDYIERFGEDALYPPDWTSARYRATLVKENGQWKILSIQTLERLED